MLLADHQYNFLIVIHLFEVIADYYYFYSLVIVLYSGLQAVQTIDGEIAQLLLNRRKHRETVGASFFDASVYAQGQMGVLPEALRPKPGHLSHSQQRVYEVILNQVPLGVR